MVKINFTKDEICILHDRLSGGGPENAKERKQYKSACKKIEKADNKMHEKYMRKGADEK